MSETLTDRELMNLKRKVLTYKEITSNTREYRSVWIDSLKSMIISNLESFAQAVELNAKVVAVEEVENLQAVTLTLGQVKSGIFEEVSETVKRHLIKHNGSLIYQQLFNGKVIVLINYPHIENIGQPRPPKTVGIYRPEEIKPPFILRHLEEFITDVTHWEDFDDDKPNEAQQIGFNINFPQHELAEED